MVSTCKAAVCVCVCAAADPLAATGGRHYGLESQQESVCPSSLSQTSTNQQKQMGVCLAGPGTVESTEELKHRESFFLSYLLKEPSTGAHHFRTCFPGISSFSALIFPHSCFLSELKFTQHLCSTLFSPRTPLRDPPFAQSRRLQPHTYI